MTSKNAMRLGLLGLAGLSMFWLLSHAGSAVEAPKSTAGPGSVIAPSMSAGNGVDLFSPARITVPETIVFPESLLPEDFNDDLEPARKLPETADSDHPAAVGGVLGGQRVAPVELDIPALEKPDESASPSADRGGTVDLEKINQERKRFDGQGNQLPLSDNSDPLSTRAIQMMDTRDALDRDVKKTHAQAQQTGIREALRLYEELAETYKRRYRFSPSRSAGAIEKIRQAAEPQVRAHIGPLVEDGFWQASKVSHSDSESEQAARRVVKIIAGWDQLLGPKYISNLSQISNGITETWKRHKADPELPIFRPKVEVRVLDEAANGGIGRIEIVVKKEKMLEKIIVVPADLMETLEIRRGDSGPRLAIESVGGSPMRSFLSPPVGVDFVAAYRERRALGDSWGSSFWLAVRGWTAAQTHYAKERLRRLLQSVLRVIGLKESQSLMQTQVSFSPELDGRWRQEDPFVDNSGNLVRVVESPRASSKLDQTTKPLRAVSANMVIGVGDRGSFVKVHALNVSAKSWRTGNQITSRGMRALIRALKLADSTPTGSWIVQDHQIWASLQLGDHEAQFYGNFVSPNKDGMIRIRYQENGVGPIHDARLYYLTEILDKLGFSTRVDEGVLTASIDKNVGARRPEVMLEAFGAAFEAVRSSEFLEPLLEHILKGSPTMLESGKRLDDLSTILLEQGALSFNSSINPEIIVSSYKKYLSQDAVRHRARTELNNQLQRFGLEAALPATFLDGRAGMDRWYHRTTDAAFARGELRFSVKDGSLVEEKDTAYDPLSPLIAQVLQQPKESVEMAALADSVAPGLMLRFKTIGRVGAFVAQLAQGRVDSDTWLTLRVLRDLETGHVRFAQADYWSHKNNKGSSSFGPVRNFRDAQEMAEFLRGLDISFASTSPPSEADVSKAKERLYAIGPGRGKSRRAFWGLALHSSSDSPIQAKITYDPSQAASGNFIFVTPFASRAKSDTEAVRRAKAVIITEGDFDSYTAQLAREAGKTVVILNEADWTNFGVQLELPDFRPISAASQGLSIQRVSSSRSLILREGDEVLVHPSTGLVELGEPHR